MGMCNTHFFSDVFASMDQTAFHLLCTECTQSLQMWMTEAVHTCEMLTDCANFPLPLDKRAALLEQRVRENEAQAIHMEIRQRLFDLAHSGVSGPDLMYGSFPI